MAPKKPAIDYILFTDGSVVWHKNKYDPRIKGPLAYSSYGLVIVNMKTYKYTTMGSELTARPILWCECYAIYKGLLKIKRITKDNQKVNVLVVTDNKLCVQAINQYMPYVWDMSDENNWKRRSGEPVKNQDIYKNIRTLLLNNRRLRIKVIHINSHQDIESQWPRLQAKFAAYGVNTSDDAARLFIMMNDLADSVARKYTKDAQQYEEIHGLGLMRLVPKGATGAITMPKKGKS